MIRHIRIVTLSLVAALVLGLVAVVAGVPNDSIWDAPHAKAARADSIWDVATN
ncbi:hypothetical protein ABH925_001337 [Streptacidiphilus sp. EB129]